MTARDEELLRLKAQISERDSSLSLRGRIKQIFKKYGLTVTAIFLAAGVTIGAVLGTITNALKKLGTDLLQLPTEIDLLRQLLQSYGISYRLPLDKATVLIVLKGL